MKITHKLPAIISEEAIRALDLLAGSREVGSILVDRISMACVPPGWRFRMLVRMQAE